MLTTNFNWKTEITFTSIQSETNSSFKIFFLLLAHSNKETGIFQPLVPFNQFTISALLQRKQNYSYISQVFSGVIILLSIHLNFVDIVWTYAIVWQGNNRLVSQSLAHCQLNCQFLLLHMEDFPTYHVIFLMSSGLFQNSRIDNI